MTLGGDRKSAGNYFIQDEHHKIKININVKRLNSSYDKSILSILGNKKR